MSSYGVIRPQWANPILPRGYSSHHGTEIMHYDLRGQNLVLLWTQWVPVSCLTLSEETPNGAKTGTGHNPLTMVTLHWTAVPASEGPSCELTRLQVMVFEGSPVLEAKLVSFSSHCHPVTKWCLEVVQEQAHFGVVFRKQWVSSFEHFGDFSWQFFQGTNHQELTHWGWDKMAAVLQTTFSNTFLEWKCMTFD